VRRALSSAPGNVIWFLDTCHAGGAQNRSPVDVNRLLITVTSAENAASCFCSSMGNEASLEAAPGRTALSQGAG